MILLLFEGTTNTGAIVHRHSFIRTSSSPPRALGYEHGRGARVAMTDGSRAACREKHAGKSGSRRGA